MSTPVENEAPILTHNGSNESELKKSKSGKKLPLLNDPNRFKHGVLVRGKFIGVEDVKKENGEDTCQTAMVKLKAVVLAKKEHKQRICVRINLEGIEILDEKTNQLMFKHAVSRISYIARDSTDSRAIGYIYKNSPNNFQYFAIKTERQAQELFNNLKDLFEVVLEMRNAEKNNKEEKRFETEKEEEKNLNEIKNENEREEIVNQAESIIDVNKPTSENLFDLPDDNLHDPLLNNGEINCSIAEPTIQPSNELLDVFNEPISNIPSVTDNNLLKENKQISQNDKYNSLLNELSNLSTSPDQRNNFVGYNQPFYSTANQNGIQNTNSSNNIIPIQNFNSIQNPFGNFNTFSNQAQIINRTQATEIQNNVYSNQSSNQSSNLFQW